MGRESSPCSTDLQPNSHGAATPPRSNEPDHRQRRIKDGGWLMDDPEAAMMRVLYDEHAAALWRYALRLTGDRARAEDVVQETLLRAWQHPHVFDDSERSPSAWLFRVARNIIIDEQRTSRRRREVSSPDGSELEQRGPDQIEAAVDRLLIADALTQLSLVHLAVVRRSYYLGWTTPP